MSVTVSAFYRFVEINDCDAVAEHLRALMIANAIKGTILLAREGINGTISGDASSLDAMLETLRRDRRFADLVDKRSNASEHPFKKVKVKIKPEIVTFGVKGADPSRTVGTYVSPDRWNALIVDPNVRLVDTRNAYEVEVGTFPGASDPKTHVFSEFPKYVEAELARDKDRPIAMFCTGGIRCEKASAYLISQGFKTVFHLEGGILKYLETIPKDESLWQGECFVFDDRVALDHGVVEGQSRLCETCGGVIAASALLVADTATPAVTGQCHRCASPR